MVGMYEGVSVVVGGSVVGRSVGGPVGFLVGSDDGV